MFIRGSMRYGIFSDIHSNLEALEAVIQAYKKEEIDKYLCIGDIVGYAASPNQCIEKARALAMVTVAGNHDQASVNLFSVDYFNHLAKEAIFWTQRALDEASRNFLKTLPLVYKNDGLTMVHGTLHDPADFNYMADNDTALKTLELLENDVCFVGHTHSPGLFIRSKGAKIHYRQGCDIDIKQNNKYIINVGSVGQPRDGNPEAAYCVYDTKKKHIQIKRVSYDIKAAAKKIIDAGLPEFLAARLLAGR